MRRLTTSVLAIAALLASVIPSSAAAKRYIVGFKTGTSAAVRAKVLKNLGGTKVADIQSTEEASEKFDAMVVDAPAGAKVGGQARRVGSGFQNDIFADAAGGGSASVGTDDGVTIEEDFTTKWIEAAAPVSFAAAPLPAFGAVMGSLPKLSATMSMTAMGFNEIPWGINRVKAPAAWDTTEGKGVKVAVIDTGIKTDHSDLNGQVVGGYNAITDSEKLGAYEDDNGHGTHVSGTIAGKRDGKGVVGVAPKAKLLAVKVLDKDGSGSLSDVIKGIIWAANNGAQVANMSLGSSQPSELMQRALKYAKARGMVVVAAAGNSGGSVGYPGAYPETIAVAASDSDDKLASFSSRGPEVKFIAPGVDVVSSWANGNWVSISGTSMAAPHVTGLAALAVAQGKRGLGGPDGVYAALKKASKSIGLKATEEGAGMVSAEKLVE